MVLLTRIQAWIGLSNRSGHPSLFSGPAPDAFSMNTVISPADRRVVRGKRAGGDLMTVLLVDLSAVTSMLQDSHLSAAGVWYGARD